MQLLARSEKGMFSRLLSDNLQNCRAMMKAVKTPEAVKKEVVDRLHDLGWTDNGIMDALAHATNMIGTSILMKALIVDQACQIRMSQ